MGNAHFARSFGYVCSSGHLQDSFTRSLLRRDAFCRPRGRRATISKMLWVTVTDFSLHRGTQVLDLHSDFCLIRSFSGKYPSSGDTDFLRYVGAWLLPCATDSYTGMGRCVYRRLRRSSWICPPNKGGFGTDCADALFKGALSRPFIQMA